MFIKILMQVLSIALDMTSTVVLNVSATTYQNTPVTVSLSGLIKPDAVVKVLSGTASVIRQNILYQPPYNFKGNDQVECEISDGNKILIAIAVIAKPVSIEEKPQVRVQTRETSTPGDPEDKYWTITKDTGPLEGAAPSPVPLRIHNITALNSIEDHPPENAIDGSKTTWFSAEGAGSWIQLDLGQICNVSELLITWDTSTDFSLAVSIDRKTMNTVYQGRSQPVTSIKMPKATAQLLKITALGNFMGISDITVMGSPITPKAYINRSSSDSKTFSSSCTS